MTSCSDLRERRAAAPPHARSAASGAVFHATLPAAQAPVTLPSGRSFRALATRLAALLLAAGAVSLAGCSGAAPAGVSGPPPSIVPEGTPGPANLRLVMTPQRPRLTLLARGGDPAAAVVAVVATDLGSAPTVALAAIVEARLLAAGLPVDTRVDRSSFRVRLLASPKATPRAFFAALAEAFRAPLVRGTPELAKAAERLAALKRNPLPAAEMAPAADCAGRLGLVPKEKIPDLLADEGVLALEKARAAALTLTRTALAVVGPAETCSAAEAALLETSGWLEGPPIVDAWPVADQVGTYAANDVAKRRSRLTVAVRIPDAPSAVSAAERLGDPRGALRARLSALPLPLPRHGGPRRRAPARRLHRDHRRSRGPFYRFRRPHDRRREHRSRHDEQRRSEPRNRHDEQRRSEPRNRHDEQRRSEPRSRHDEQRRSGSRRSGHRSRRDVRAGRPRLRERPRRGHPPQGDRRRGARPRRPRDRRARRALRGRSPRRSRARRVVDALGPRRRSARSVGHGARAPAGRPRRSRPRLPPLRGGSRGRAESLRSRRRGAPILGGTRPR